MMASANFQQTMEEQPQFQESNDGNLDSSGDSTMPKISQVMSLQPALLQSPVDPSFSMDSPSNQVFNVPGPSTSSGASTSTGMPKISLKSPSTRVSVVFFSLFKLGCDPFHANVTEVHLL